jgi:threonine/homoserine/homoserine lactone efflux protein
MNIDWHLYLAFGLASVVLIAIPGPNVALITATSVAYGTRRGLLTVAGTSSAMAVQLALTAIGLTSLLGVMAVIFDWLRWLGAAYLIYLGMHAWRMPADRLSLTAARPRAARAIWLRGFLVSLTNPKTLLFYSAFLPQFIAPDRPVGMQLAVLSVTFFGLAAVLDSAWAIFAGRLRSFLLRRGRLRHRVTGTLLIGAGCGLMLAQRQ